MENITDKVKKRNHLLHLGGIQLQDVAYSLPDAIIEKDETNDVFEILTKKLSDHFSPKQNSTFERHVFRNVKMDESENFNKFLLKIRHQAKRCYFGKTEAEALEINMKDKIIDSWAPIDLKKKILEKERTLDEVIELCQIHEQISNQSSAMGPKTSEVTTSINKIKFQRNDKFEKCTRRGRFNNQNHIQTCPAKDAKCFTCNMQGHFSSCCKTPQHKRKQPNFNINLQKNKRFKSKVNSIELENENSGEENNISNFDCFTINYQGRCTPSDDLIKCSIGGVNLILLIDSGSKANIIKDTDFNYLLQNKAIIWGTSTSTLDVLKPYGTITPLEITKKILNYSTNTQWKRNNNILLCS